MSCEKGMFTGHKISGIRFVLVDGKSYVFHWLIIIIVLYYNVYKCNN